MATELFREVSASESAEEELRAAARAEHDRVFPRLAHLSLRVSGDPEDVVVTLDGETADPDSWGVPMTVDPGRHEAWAVRNDQVIAREELVLEESEYGALELQIPMVPMPAEAAATVAQEEPSNLDRRVRRRRILAISAGAIAVVALVVVIVLTAGSNDPTETDLPPVAFR